MFDIQFWIVSLALGAQGRLPKSLGHLHISYQRSHSESAELIHKYLERLLESCFPLISVQLELMDKQMGVLQDKYPGLEKMARLAGHVGLGI
jgi:hypothetical protein